MSSTFSVKNFERFQHYKDRSPPWIRLYNSLLDDYEFGQLPDASKAHLSAIWLLASRYDNKIPLDPDWVARRINATEPVNLDLLAAKGFIVVDQPCIKTLAERKQSSIPETEESRAETDTSSLRSDVASAQEKVPRETLPRKPSRKPIICPPDWTPDYDDALELGVTLAEAIDQGQRMRDWSVAGNRAKADWQATYRNWIKRFIDEKASRPNAKFHHGTPASARQSGTDAILAAVARKFAPGDDDGGGQAGVHGPHGADARTAPPALGDDRTIEGEVVAAAR